MSGPNGNVKNANALLKVVIALAVLFVGSLTTATVVNTMDIAVMSGNRYTVADAKADQQLNDQVHLEIRTTLGDIRESLARIEERQKAQQED